MDQSMDPENRIQSTSNQSIHQPLACACLLHDQYLYLHLP
jgi:hypothetical protein